MTTHEAMNFIDALHSCIERSVENPGPWCWPTWQLLTYNLRLNRKAFPRARSLKSLRDAFNTQVLRAVERGWITEGPCVPHCHAKHLVITGAGREALRLMNEKGCGPLCSTHRETKLHLERKVA